MGLVQLAQDLAGDILDSDELDVKDLMQLERGLESDSGGCGIGLNEKLNYLVLFRLTWFSM